MSIHRHHCSRVKMRVSTHRRDFSPRHRRAGVFFELSSPLRSHSRRAAAAILACAFALSLIGCEQNPLGSLNPRGNPPVLSKSSFTPSSVQLNAVAPVGGVYPVKFIASTFVTDPDGADQIMSVTVSVTDPDGTVRMTSGLHDDGVAPDGIAGDGFYTGSFTLNLTKSDFGRYHVTFSSVDRGNREATSVISTLTIGRPNLPPWLYNLTAPDTVDIPAHGRTPFVVAVQAGDSDGIGDIVDVILRVTGGGSPGGVLHLLDQNNVANKDSVKGEWYSITLQVDSTNTPKRYDLLLQAIDRTGDTSATLTHSLTLR